MARYIGRSLCHRRFARESGTDHGPGAEVGINYKTRFCRAVRELTTRAGVELIQTLLAPPTGSAICSGSKWVAACVSGIMGGAKVEADLG